MGLQGWRRDRVAVAQLEVTEQLISHWPRWRRVTAGHGALFDVLDAAANTAGSA